MKTNKKAIKFLIKQSWADLLTDNFSKQAFVDCFDKKCLIWDYVFDSYHAQIADNHFYRNQMIRAYQRQLFIIVEQTKQRYDTVMSKFYKTSINQI